MKNYVRSFAGVFIVTAGASAFWSQPGLSETPVIVADTFANLQQHVQYLSGDELRGRSVADDSIDVAADYVAARMSDIGLDMTAIDGGPMQPVSIPLEVQAGSAESNFATFQIAASAPNDPQTETGEPKTIRAALDQDMMPMSIGLSAATVQAPLAFVGYGIVAPKLGYDEYASIDVSGHAVMVLRKEPQASDPSSRFDGVNNTRHAFFANKVANAIEQGALAIILVSDAESTSRAVQEIQTRIDGEKARRTRIQSQLSDLPADAINTQAALAKKLTGIDTMLSGMEQQRSAAQRGLMAVSTAGNAATGQDKPKRNVPVISISRTVADQLLHEATGKTLLETEVAIDADLVPASKILTGVSVKLGVEIKPTQRISNNVVGVLAGRGSLADETVIVGAHYDHVGMGGVGSLAPGTIAVHNGADDNASGTAAMLEAAAKIKRRLEASPDHRRVVFIAFTGEERGLLGSKHYVRNPRFPLSDTVAMINLDMVGRLRDNELTVYGTGTADQMDRIAEESNASLAAVGQEFDLFKVPTGYGPSDHQSFYVAGVPVLFYFTGLHNDYHRPSDDFVKIDFGGLTRITDIITESCWRIATEPQRLIYSETENKFKMRWQKTAYLGVSLSVQEDKSGVRSVIVTAVKADSPADVSGIRNGDQLIQIGQQKVLAVGDVLSAIRSQKPGETIALRLVRGGEITLIDVTLDARE